MRIIFRGIESIVEWVGKSVRWLAVVLVAVMTCEVIMRYCFDAPTMWAYESAIMIGGVMYICAFSYVHRHHAHLRVDVLYTIFPPRVKAIVDVIGGLLCFFPVAVSLSYISIIWMLKSWAIEEKMVETYWYPPAAPFRTFVAIGIVLFLLQGTVQFIRDSYMVIRNKYLD